MGVLESDISIAKDLIEAGLSVRQFLMDRMNHSSQSQSALSRFSRQILALIFQYCTGSDFPLDSDQGHYESDLYNGESEDGDEELFESRSVLHLGLVCKSWKDAAWSTPSLWTSVTIHLNSSERNYACIRRANAWFSRSGNLPLLFRVIHSQHRWTWTEQRITIAPSSPSAILLSEILVKYQRRWLLLDIQCPSFILEELKHELLQSESWSFLSTLRANAILPWSEETLPQIPLLPHIKCLSLHRVSLHFISPSSVCMLTHAELKSVSLDDCVQLVAHAPLLRSFKIENPKGPWPELDTHAPVIGSNVRSFSCEGDRVGIRENLLDLFVFPSLEELTLNAGIFDPTIFYDSNKTKRRLLSSGCRLKKLITYVSLECFADGNLCSFLADFPSIQTLKLLSIDPSSHSLSNAFFQRLSKTKLLSEESFLPELTSLTIQIEGAQRDFSELEFPWSSVPDIFGVPNQNISSASSSLPLSEDPPRRLLRKLRIYFKYDPKLTDEEGEIEEEDSEYEYTYAGNISIPCIGSAVKKLRTLQEKGIDLQVRYMSDEATGVDIDLIELSERIPGLYI